MQGNDGHYDYPPPRPYLMHDLNTSSEAAPIILTTNPPIHAYNMYTMGDQQMIDYSQQQSARWGNQSNISPGYVPNNHVTQALPFLQAGHALHPDPGHPFGYPRLSPSHPASSAPPDLPFNQPTFEPQLPQSPLGRSKSLSHGRSSRGSHEESHPSAMAAAVRPATSWPAMRAVYGHDNINSCTPPGALTGISNRSSFSNSPPASSYYPSHPATPRDFSPHLHASSTPHEVVLPLIGPATDAQVADFIYKSFPSGTPNFEAMRAALRDVLYSDWKLHNMEEPDKNYLLQFVTMNGSKWECLFYVGHERCPCSSTRKIQAVEHIRRHIRLEPFACIGEACPEHELGCSQRYSSPDPLRKHRKGKATCNVCGRDVLPGNMRRHLENNCHEDA